MILRKTKWSIIAFVVTLSLTLTSCDYPSSLIINNKTKDDVIIKAYIEEQDSISVKTFEIPYIKGEEYCIYSFSEFHKTWGEENINNFVKNIQKVEIITSSYEKTLRKHHLLLLLTKHGGSKKRNIKITID
ncbi:hypothetical protein M2138_001504 [Dysgonomonadaceae bacterium PH5-43]|nr:hypothetical protein [Dysgonomonadaceae bacterium PH5-43]